MTTRISVDRSKFGPNLEPLPGSFLQRPVIPMSSILQRLREDHSNLGWLLGLLDRQISLMERGDRPDFDIIQGVIDYCDTYLEMCHHPLEDKSLHIWEKRTAPRRLHSAGWSPNTTS